MPRAQAFDQQSVIRAARTAFWANGYEATSIPELEEATRLSRSSIYNTFGSKRALFDAAVENYLDEVVRPRLLTLNASPVPPDALGEYLEGLISAFERLPNGANHGCLLINAAGAPIAADPEVARVITSYRAELQLAIQRGLDASQRTADATVITSLVVAAFALARVNRVEAIRTLRSAHALIAA